MMSYNLTNDLRVMMINYIVQIAVIWGSEGKNLEIDGDRS